MQFDGAITNARSSVELADLKRGAVVFVPSSSGRSMKDKLRDSPASYIGCELHPDGLEDFEEIFDIFAPIQARQIAVSTVHDSGHEDEDAIPSLDIGFRFDIPLASGSVRDVDVKGWLETHTRSLTDAVQLSWLSRNSDTYLPLDFYDRKLIFPK